MLGALLVGLLAPSTPPPALYVRHCARCHGLNRDGRGPENILLPGADLTDAKRRQAWTREALVKLILQGRGAMPSHQAKLAEADAGALADELMRENRKPAKKR